MKEYILIGLLAYLVFCLSEICAELYIRYVRKKKILRFEIDVADYMELKKVLKSHGNAYTVEKYLKFHVKEDIKDILERYE